MPFQDLCGSQILQHWVINGKHPVRLNSPPIDDGIWNVIQHCWLQDPSKRPMVKQIVKAGMMFTSLPLLLTSLSEVCLRLGGINASMLTIASYRYLAAQWLMRRLFV